VSALGDEQRRQDLASGLARIRVAAGIPQADVAAALGVDQSTVSRIERGDWRRPIPLVQVVAWLKVTDAPEEQQARLLALAEAVIAGPQSWEAASGTGSADLGPQTAELEARTGLLSNYQPAVIPGLLQTPEYARRLMSSGPDGPPVDLGERVVNRIERARVLYDDSKRFRFVIPEAVLRWPYGPPDDPAVLDEHREQLARVRWAASRPNVTVGILPLAPVAAWRSAGFVIFDEVQDGDPLVHLEMLTQPYNVTEPAKVEKYRRGFANLLAASVTGDEARRLIASAAADLRG
jgi:transcriptional regulator with XRE-family HTH domain